MNKKIIIGNKIKIIMIIRKRRERGGGTGVQRGRTVDCGHARGRGPAGHCQLRNESGSGALWAPHFPCPVDDGVTTFLSP